MKNHAKTFAENAHKGQTRKGSNVPYIIHPIRVADRLEQAGFSDELVCAGYLHDVVEDTTYEMEDIEEAFGKIVASIVAAHTEDKSKSWQERKQHTIDTVKSADKEVKYLIVADKLDNLLGLKKALDELGEEVWQHFNAGFDKQKWYNESIVKNMYTGLRKEVVPEYFGEYEKIVKQVFS